MKFSLRNRLITIGVIAAILLGVAVAFDAYFFSSYRIDIHHETLTNRKIPASHDGMTIACFGDLEYGTFMDAERFSNIVEEINRLSPDVIIFLGDLYDQAYTPTEEEEEAFVQLLSTLRADEGKFAVYGDFDQEKKEMVQSDLYRAGFELLTNQVLSLHHGQNESISLVGLEYESIETSSINDIYSSIEEGTYTMAVCHTPDVATLLPMNSTDILVSSHSHNAQISWPLIGASTDDSSYAPGKHVFDEMSIYVSRGIGTTNKDVRLFSDPEILLFRISAP